MFFHTEKFKKYGEAEKFPAKREIILQSIAQNY